MKGAPTVEQRIWEICILKGQPQLGSLCQRQAMSKGHVAVACTTPKPLRQKPWLLAGPLQAHESSPAALATENQRECKHTRKVRSHLEPLLSLTSFLYEVKHVGD